MFTPRRLAVRLALLGLVGTIGALGHHFGGRAHIRRRLGQEPLANASCLNCHFVSTQRLPWAKPRPHHDSPAGLAVTPDGNHLFIALDDRDEIAEADTVSRNVLRRVKVPGKPFGLALDTTGRNLFVTCKDQDRVVQLDSATLETVGSAPTGMGPVAVAFCRTKIGDRLVVANSMSDDISVFSVEPLKELSRLNAGREPYAVATAPGNGRAFVANRLVGLSSVKSVPESELTVVDTANRSCHPASGIGVRPSFGRSLPGAEAELGARPNRKSPEPGADHAGRQWLGHVERARHRRLQHR